MKITNTSRELTKKEQYMMTLSPQVESISKMEDGATLTVNAWLEYEDTNSKGEQVEILSLLGFDDLGVSRVWACQSATFKRSFNDIYNIFGEGVKIVKLSGLTKNERPYINCDLAE